MKEQSMRGAIQSDSSNPSLRGACPATLEGSGSEGRSLRPERLRRGAVLAALLPSILITGCPAAPAGDSQDTGEIDGTLGDQVEDQLAELQSQVTEMQSQVTDLQEQVTDLQSRVAELEGAGGTYGTDTGTGGTGGTGTGGTGTGGTGGGGAGYITADELDSRLAEYVAADEITQLIQLDHYLEISEEENAVHIVGANVFIQSGSGATNGDPSDPSRSSVSDSVNGLGNLFIGYNERSAGEPEEQSGSHNLIVGPYHTATSYGSIIAGYGSESRAQYTSVTGGLNNIASAPFAAVSGGVENTAGYDYAAVHGGRNNVATGYASSVVGGYLNTAAGDYSAAVSGAENYISGDYGAIVSGYSGVVSGSYSAILGGDRNSIDSKALYSTVCGGQARGNTTSYSVLCD